MPKIAGTLTDLIGNTPLLELRRYSQDLDLKGRLVVKL